MSNLFKYYKKVDRIGRLGSSGDFPTDYLVPKVTFKYFFLIIVNYSQTNYLIKK